MKEYCKITTDGQAKDMSNPFVINLANPTQEQKDVLAPMFGYLEKVYTDVPEYDQETQYVTDYWMEEDGKAVQHWEVHEKPEPEPTIEDRVDSLEQNVSDIISGETE